MRIQNNYTSGLQKMYEQQKRSPVKSGHRTDLKKDGVDLSPDARFYNAAQKALKELPELPTANLEHLKEIVKNGGYHVPEGEIAEKIIKDVSVDRLI